MKSISVKLKLYNDPSVREKLRIMLKFEALVDDSRNDPDDIFWKGLDNFLEWNKNYEFLMQDDKTKETISCTGKLVDSPTNRNNYKLNSEKIELIFRDNANDQMTKFHDDLEDRFLRISHTYVFTINEIS